MHVIYIEDYNCIFAYYAIYVVFLFPQEDDPSRCLLLAIGVCYLARLEEETREKYADYLSEQLQWVIGARDNDNSMGKHFLFEQIEL